MMNSTFGAPARVRLGAGEAGLDTSKVRPITPGKAWPDLYSLSDIFSSLFTKGGGCSSFAFPCQRTAGSLSLDTFDVRERPGAVEGRLRRPVTAEICGPPSPGDGVHVGGGFAVWLGRKHVR